MKRSLLVIAACTALGLAACSSAPKRPAELFTTRTLARTQLELAHREADRGNYEAALDILAEGQRLAVSADDPTLLVRHALARGNIFFAQGKAPEALETWNAALAEAEKSGETELAALCRVYMARARLLAAPDEAERIRAGLHGELGRIKQDTLSIALTWTVIGMAEKESRRWNEAEAAIKKALEIHQKGSYLEQAAYDWFLIASVRSMAGNYDAARDALGQALGFDRRAENSFGLAADWRALGDVYRKAGKTAEAEAAYRRSAEIYRSIGLEKEAAAVEGR